MGRWDISDEGRSPNRGSANTPERTENTRSDRELEVTPLADRVSPRSRDDLAGGRGDNLTLPDGRDREDVPTGAGPITCAAPK